MQYVLPYLCPAQFVRVLLAVVLWALLGCGTSYQTAIGAFRSNLPERYQQSEADVQQQLQAERLGNWWEDFRDQELNILLEEVVRGNLDIQIAVARLEQAQARAKESNSFLWPSVSTTGAANRTRTNVRAFTSTFTGGAASGVSSVTTTRYGVSVPVIYEIDIWGKLRSRARAGALDALASEQDLASALMTLSADTTEAYFLALELCQQRSLLNQTIAADKKFLELIVKRYRDGLSAPLDVYQAKQNLTARLAQLPDFERQLVSAQNRLDLLAGRYPRYLDTCEEVPDLPGAPPAFAAGVPGELLLQRPDLRALLLQLEAADARYAAAVRNRLPSLRLNASAGYEGLDLSELFRPETFVWSLVSDLGITLFDGGQKRAQVSLAEAQVAELLARYLKQSLEAFAEVENALAGERYARRQVALLREKQEAVRRTLRLSTEQYLQGVDDYLPVLLAQGSYYAAQRELIAARRFLLSQRVQLVRSLGGSWHNADSSGPVESKDDLDNYLGAEQGV